MKQLSLEPGFRRQNLPCQVQGRYLPGCAHCSRLAQSSSRCDKYSDSVQNNNVITERENTSAMKGKDLGLPNRNQSQSCHRVGLRGESWNCFLSLSLPPLQNKISPLILRRPILRPPVDA